jgi:hypothetical protein
MEAGTADQLLALERETSTVLDACWHVSSAPFCPPVEGFAFSCLIVLKASYSGAKAGRHKEGD